MSCEPLPPPMSATTLDAGEVVGVEDRARFAAVDADHRGVEDLGLVVMFAQVVEDRLAKNFVERFLAGLDAVDDFAPGPELLVARHERQRPLRAGHVRLQRLGQRRERELARRAFAKNADAGQGAQQAIERVGIGGGFLRELVDGARAGGDEVGNAKLGRGVDGLREPVAGDHPVELNVRRGFIHWGWELRAES